MFWLNYDMVFGIAMILKLDGANLNTGSRSSLSSTLYILLQMKQFVISSTCILEYFFIWAKIALIFNSYKLIWKLSPLVNVSVCLKSGLNNV